MTDKPETVADVLKWLHACAKDAKDRGHQLAPSVFTTIANRIERAASAGPVCIVCDWQGDTARFIEAEIDGASVSLPWNDRPDGLKELRIERIVGPASLVTERMRKLAMAAFLSSKSDELIDCIGDALAAAHAPPAVPVESPPASVPDGFVLIDRADLVGIARILERDGDEHGAARELRNLLRTTPEESP